MADNSVTIALKIDASQFNAGIAQAHAEINKLGFTGGKGGGRRGGGSPSGASISSTVSQDMRLAEKYYKQVANESISLERAFRSMQMANLNKEVRLADRRSNEAIKMNLSARGGGEARGRGASPRAVTKEKSENLLQRIFSSQEKGVAQSVAMLKGNYSAANTLGAINMVSGASLGMLGTIAGFAALIVVGIAMLQTALKPVMSILGAIGKVLGAALIPIAMVIVTLLQPLMILLMPLVRILRAIFQPLQSRIRAFFSGQGKEMLKSGDYAGFALAFTKQVGIGLVESLIVLFGEVQKLMLDSFGVILQSLVSLFFSPLKVMVSIIGALLYTIPGVPESVHQSIKDLSTNLDNMEASIKKGIVESITWAKDKIDENVKGILSIIQTIDPLNKKDMTPFNKTVDDTIAGLDRLNNYGKPTAPDESPAKGGGTFGLGMSMMDITGMFLPGGKLGPKFYPGGTDMPGGQISTEGLGEPEQTRSLLDKIFGIDGVISRGISETKSIVSGIVRNEDDSIFNRMLKGLTAINAMVREQIETNPGSLKAVIFTGFQVIIDWFKVNIALLQMLISSVPKPKTSDVSISKKVNDVVITPGGQMIETSPQDYLLAMKNPGSLIGGEGISTTINITVQGNVDDKTARFITDTVQREIAQQWRAIAR